MTAGGIFPAIYGTAVLTLLMTVAVMPVGVATAVYLHEYAPAALAASPALVRVAVTNLAGVPSIVFGLFGLGFFIQFVGGGLDRAFSEPGDAHLRPARARLGRAHARDPDAAGGDRRDRGGAARRAARAPRREPRARRDAVPDARAAWCCPRRCPGILTGAILAVARGAGEVAPILFTGVAYFLPDLPDSVWSQFMHLGYHVYVLATQSPDVEATRPLLYATVFVLLALTFALNLVAIAIRTRTRRKAAAGH